MKVLRFPAPPPRKLRPEKFGPLITEKDARSINSARMLLKGLLDELAQATVDGKLKAWRRAGHAIIDLIGEDA